MTTGLRVAACGGDKRYERAHQLFLEKSFDCSYITLENVHNLGDYDIIILPISTFDREGNLAGTDRTIYDLLQMLKSGSIIFAGKVPALIKQIAAEYKIILYDYTDNEEFNILNAVSTAEGAILTALEKTSNTIWNSSFTVLGYGRIGRCLSIRLRALGANVTVGARSVNARANALSDMINAVTIDEAIKTSGSSLVVFNTIPAPIITEDNIGYMEDSFIIDLASIPGGLTERAKEIMGEKFIHALALPGKCFPNTAGEAIYKTIYSILHEKGVI